MFFGGGGGRSTLCSLFLIYVFWGEGGRGKGGRGSGMELDGIDG